MKARISSYYLFYFLAFGSGTPFLTLLLRQRGISTSQIGLLLAMGALAATLTQPLIGHMNDQYNRPRTFILISAIFSPLIFLGYVVFSNFWILLFITILFTILQGSSSIADALTLNLGENSGFSYGEIRLWGALGYALVVAFAGYIYNKLGISVSIWVYALFSIPLLYVIWLLPNHTVPDKSQIHLPKGYWDLWRNRKLMTFIGINFLVTTSIIINANYFPLYYQGLHYPMQWVGLNFTVAALIEIPIFYFSNKIIKRFGQLTTVILGTACFSIYSGLMAIAPGYLMTIFIQSINGVGYALYWSASVEMINQLAPINRKSSAQTLNSAIAGSVSTIVGSFGGGWLLELLGPVHMYGIITLANVLSIGFYLLIILISDKAQ